MKEIHIEPERCSLKEVQGTATGIVAVLTLILGVVSFSFLKLRSNNRFVILLLIAFALMAFVEIFYYKIYKRNFNFKAARQFLPANRINIKKKFTAVLVSFAVATFLYWVFSEYALPSNIFDFASVAKSWYHSFFFFYFIVVPIIISLCVPYFFIVEKYGTWDSRNDDLLILYDGYFSIIRFKMPDPRFYNVLKGLCVKFFFIPLMITFFMETSVNFENAVSFLVTYGRNASKIPGIFLYKRIFTCMSVGLFYIDLSLAVIGYSLTNRLFDTHIRSTEPTLFGWSVAVLCYQPINVLTDKYFDYGVGGRDWDLVLCNSPVMFCIIGASIVVLLVIYVWATVMFGLRFSNLTNRGILSKGPFAVVRHPAYIAKNLSWWLTSLPFLVSFENSIRLLMFNLVYFLRAITEERHLKNDPHYIEYMKKVKYRFIPYIY